MNQTHDIPDGIRAGLPLVLPTLALGVSFGVLAKPVMGSVAPIVMSVIVFSGAAQFAALSVLAAGGGAFAAIVAGLLLNLRFLPMGFAVAPALRGRPLARAAQGQALVDASFAIASRQDGIGADAVCASRRAGGGRRGGGAAGTAAEARVSDTWITIGVLAVCTLGIKASGPLSLGGRSCPSTSRQ